MKSELPEETEQPPSNHQLLFRVTPHIKKLAKKSAAVRAEFFPSPKEAKVSEASFSDPLNEDRFIKVKGLVHKYPQRVLIELTMNCAAYCRFCTRRRKVSDLKKGQLTPKDLSVIAGYLSAHPEINEIVISGGDPLTAPELLKELLKKCQKIKSLKIIRIHTRIPVSNPKLVTPGLIKILNSIKGKPLYLSIHFEHPDELTPETIAAVNKIRKTGAILLSQSVFLKGINDSFETLKELFIRLTELGVRPYYLYRCDPVAGAEHFRVPFEREIEIMTKLRVNLSGISCPLYALDAPTGSGKIPVPLNFWQFDKKTLTDFNGKKIKIQ
ncbi:MAG: KamA family radical SAM protein [Patescibacteria group bacterium]